jgi:hypothetical protein
VVNQHQQEEEEEDWGRERRMNRNKKINEKKENWKKEPEISITTVNK